MALHQLFPPVVETHTLVFHLTDCFSQEAGCQRLPFCCCYELIIVHSNSVSFSSLRSLFARRVKENQPVEQKDPGWKLFGKVPLRESPLKDPKKIQKVESVIRPGVQQNLRGFILCVACGTSIPIELPERMETWAVVASASDEQQSKQ